MIYNILGVGYGGGAKKNKTMKNSELILSLIDLEEDKDIVICISGDYHKITGFKQLGSKILLEVEGSIMCIEREFHDYMTKKYPKTTFIKSAGK